MTVHLPEWAFAIVGLVLGLAGYGGLHVFWGAKRRARDKLGLPRE